LPPLSLCHAQNPALRHELSFEMGQVHSDMALHFDTNSPANAVLQEEQRPRRKAEFREMGEYP